MFVRRRLLYSRMPPPCSLLTPFVNEGPFFYMYVCLARPVLPAQLQPQLYLDVQLVKPLVLQFQVAKRHAAHNVFDHRRRDLVEPRHRGRKLAALGITVSEGRCEREHEKARDARELGQRCTCEVPQPAGGGGRVDGRDQVPCAFSKYTQAQNSHNRCAPELELLELELLAQWAQQCRNDVLAADRRHEPQRLQRDEACHRLKVGLVDAPRLYQRQAGQPRSQ